MKKTIAIVQVRLSSSRLPNKALIKIDSKHTLLDKVILNLQRSKMLNKIVIATSIDKTDDQIYEFSKKKNINCVRGSLNNVLSRFEDTLKIYNGYDYVVRVTGDCPIIDPKVLDFYITINSIAETDLISSNFQSSLLVGYDCKSVKVYDYLFNNCKSLRDKEHVGSFLLKTKPNFFKKTHIILPKWLDNLDYKISIDNPEDMKFIQSLYRNYTNDILTSIPSLFQILTYNKNLININKKSKESLDNLRLKKIKESKESKEYRNIVNFIYE